MTPTDLLERGNLVAVKNRRHKNEIVVHARETARTPLLRHVKGVDGRQGKRQGKNGSRHRALLADQSSI